MESMKQGLNNEIQSIKNKISKSPSDKTGWNWKFGKSAYYWSKPRGFMSTWEEARLWCMSMGKTSHLVKIETKEENDYLKEQFRGYDSWIGLSDVETEGTFRWVDGSQLAFSHWYPGQPSNYGGNE